MALPAPGKQVWSVKLWMSCLFVLFFLSFVRCDWEGDIRLMFGRSPSLTDEGRVEIFHAGQWGTICSNDWDDDDAKVVCRQRGYSGDVGAARSDGTFGPGSGPIHLNQVPCVGTERRLTSCSPEFGIRFKCDHSQDAGVYCGDIIAGTIRLVDGYRSDEGRVEIFHAGQWGTICSNDWDDYDAKVVCRQRGYSGDVGVARSGGSFGQGSGPIHLDYVSCSGFESRLTICNPRWGLASCRHSQDAGVYCGDIKEGTIRLVDGYISDEIEGRVEIFLGGQWGTVCDDGWDDLDARVVCRQRGYSGNVGVARSLGFYGQGADPVHLGDVSCSGDEYSLTDCSNAQLRNRIFCGHSQDAGVYCGDITEGTIKLFDGYNPDEIEGRVEIFLDGRWGTVCPDGWDDLDARVVCRQLGYSGNVGFARSDSSFGQGSGPINLDRVGCSGDESRLTKCSYSGRRNNYSCGYVLDAGVYCGAGADPAGGIGGGQRGGPMDIIEGTIQLMVDGHISDGDEGRVEIFHDGQWGRVCDTGWDDRDARVVCRQRGYSHNGGLARSGGSFGRGSGPVHLDDVGCSGSESRLTDCSNPGWGKTNCGHGQDAGVYCGAGKNPAGGSGGDQGGDPMEPQTHPTMETSSRAASVMESVGMCFSLLTMLAIIAIC